MFRLLFRDSGISIKSDKVYKSTKLKNFGAQLQGSEKKPIFIEFELSEEYIVITLSRKKKKKGIKRIALVGDFEYEDGYLDDAIIFGAANDDPFSIKQSNGSQRNYGQTWSPQDGRGVEVQNTYFGSSFGLALNAMISSKNLQSQYDVCRDINWCDFSYDNGYESKITTEGVKISIVEQGGGYNGVRNWMGLDMFPDNWWDSPFQNNLI